jgi:hypothetical protein
MMKLFSLAGVAAAALWLAAGAANANTYDFGVTYSGGGVAALDGGSDDLLNTTMMTGDNFTYTLSAAGAGEWTSLTSSGIFPFLALSISEADTRTNDFTIELRNNGVSVFTHSEAGAINSFAHLGSNTVSLTSGLVWDQWILTSNIVDAGPSTAASLLPWPGNGPEIFSPDAISYSAGVPEPATWSLIICGFGMAGAMLRRRKPRARIA